MANGQVELERSHNALSAALRDVEDRYTQANPKSLARWTEARAHMPGGNTRTVLHFDPYPVAITKGDGARIDDLDGHSYTDFLGEYSAGLFGHSNSIIGAAIKEAVDGGLTLGAPNRWEAKFSALICDRFQSIDLVRFTNSGTEANLMAIGAARAFTKRNKVMVFEGGYHGGVLSFANRTSWINAPFDYIFGTFNDLDATQAAVLGNANELAAILVEPMLGSGGCINAEPAFLRALREAADEHGIVLIFDEVMTSRSSSGGLQKRLGIEPDLTTLGKYLGGGCSFGAFGGRKDIMCQFDPTSPKFLSHAGTFNNNVLTMAAGCAALSQVFTEEVADDLYVRGEGLRVELNRVAQQKGKSLRVTGTGSIMCIHPVSRPVRTLADTVDPMPDRGKLLHLELFLRGFAFSQRGYISLNLAMSDDDLSKFARNFGEVIDTHGEFWE